MTQTTARVFGVVFLLVGVLGLVTTPFSMAPDLLLGLFPVNVLHNLVHLAFGAWGLVAGGSLGRATAYCRIGGVAYLDARRGGAADARRGSDSCRSADTTSGSTRSSAASWRPSDSWPVPIRP